MKICPVCKGKGFVTETTTCWRCGGTGRGRMHGKLTPLFSPKVGPSPVTEIIDHCRICHGSGIVIQSFKCKMCGGTGYIKESNEIIN